MAMAWVGHVLGWALLAVFWAGWPCSCLANGWPVDGLGLPWSGLAMAWAGHKLDWAVLGFP